jgi:hypothetical protein
MFDEISVSMFDNMALTDLHTLLTKYTKAGAASEEQLDVQTNYDTLNKEFESTITAEQQELYKKVKGAESDNQFIVSKQSFILGYKIATRIMLESVKGP